MLFRDVSLLDPFLHEAEFPLHIYRSLRLSPVIVSEQIENAADSGGSRILTQRLVVDVLLKLNSRSST